jgi:hypothetical protein
MDDERSMAAPLDQEFLATDKFDSFTTFERGRPIHAASDGPFAAFNGVDELVTEDEGTEDLYRFGRAFRTEFLRGSPCEWAIL